MVKNIIKNLLGERGFETIRFYKNFGTYKQKEIYHFLDRKTIQYLETYPEFQMGEVSFLKNKIKFSHANSFIHSIEELFVDKVYTFKSDQVQPYIIDCGSNIGLSIIFFKTLYANARILAFEPDKEIFGLLEENMKSFGYENIQLLNEAVWNKTEELYFFSEGALAGSLTTDYSKSNNKTVISAVDLLKYINRPIDLLKMDIEGAEYTVVKHIAKNLFHVKNLFIEYHSDRSKPQELGNLLTIISNAGFRYYIKEAISITAAPLINDYKDSYDLQLNLFCYR